MKSFSALIGLENLLFFFLYVTLKRNFLQRKSFRGDLNEAISLAELRVYMENFPQEEFRVQTQLNKKSIPRKNLGMGSLYNFMTFSRYSKETKTIAMLCAIWYHLQFKKREKHPWTSVTFSKLN